MVASLPTITNEKGLSDCTTTWAQVRPCFTLVLGASASSVLELVCAGCTLVRSLWSAPAKKECILRMGLDVLGIVLLQDGIFWVGD